jgi:phage gpG-like protein
MANNINIKIEGVEKAIANIKKWQLVKHQACEDVLKEIGFKVERDAKLLCPVKTGRLRSSLSTNWSQSGKARGRTGGKAQINDGVGEPQGPRGLVVVVGTNVKYAASVEYGHLAKSKQGEESFFGLGIGVSTIVKGRPYLTPAYLMHKGEVEPRLGQILKKDIKGE